MIETMAENAMVFLLRANKMTLREILEAIPFLGWPGNNSTGLLWIVVIGMSLIEVSPVKVNPWKWLGKSLQKFLGISDIQEELENIRRARIISFDDELCNGIEHRKDMFDTILVDCDLYERYCREHSHYVNSVANDSIQHIRETYHRLRAEGKFNVSHKQNN